MKQLWMVTLLYSMVLNASLGIDAPASPVTVPAAREQIVHVLNRITFGVRPGDVEAVEKIGLDRYIEMQLHPETLDDSAVENQLADFKLLNLSQIDLHHLHKETNNRARQKKEEKRQAQRAEADAANSPAPSAEAATDPALPATNPADQRRARRRLQVDSPTGLMQINGNYYDSVLELSHAKLIRAIDSPRQLQEVLVDFWDNHFNVDSKKGGVDENIITIDRDTIRPNIFGRFRDLLEASAKSPAMLNYLDNASNSVPAPETATTPRKRRELRQPAAESPNGDPEMDTAEASVSPPKKKRRRTRGINENYARELMELHTLGVDAGYTQADVQEVARCFTGWTIDGETGGFGFKPWLHDDGLKVVLGHQIPAHGGIKDGEDVLDILCAQPACAHFISNELCQRFVGDNPDKNLVDRVASVFVHTNGDLREVTAAILKSPEFLNPATFGNKIKSPSEFAISAVRASGAAYVEKGKFLTPGGPRRVDAEMLATSGSKKSGHYASLTPETLNWSIYSLGEPLFSCTPPTGYGEVSSKWVNPGALIGRLNFALDLTGQKIVDVNFSPKPILGETDLDQPAQVLDRCLSVLLQGHVSNTTKQVLAKAALPAGGTGQTVDPKKLIALIIGSPEFQRK